MKSVHTIMKLLVPSPIFTLLMGYNQAYARKKVCTEQSYNVKNVTLFLKQTHLQFRKKAFGAHKSDFFCFWIEPHRETIVYYFIFI